MVFDGQEVLIDNFDWNVSQVLRFMKMGQNIWESMNQQLVEKCQKKALSRVLKIQYILEKSC
jgi:hypothetical protein